MSSTVSDLLPTVAAALNTPEALIKRSAAARAAANGTTIDDVLAAWAGGAPIVAAAPSAAAEPAIVTAEDKSDPAPEPVAAPAASVIAEPLAVTVEAEPEPAVPLEPVPLSKRIRSATRVGAWTGAVLGLTGFLVATTWWAQNATVTGEGPFTPVIQTTSRTVIIGAALVSILFGAITAGLSRASAAWASPGMQLRNSASSTGWLGAVIGLVLGIGAAALLTSGFGTPVEGTEGMVQLPVLPTLAVMLLGGAVLGAITAAITQTVAVPVAVEAGEVADVRSRLGGALTIPAVALLTLVLLVLPFAWGLIQSAEITKEAAALVAIITAIGILGFASLAGTRPNVKITFGEAMVALLGIVTVLIIVFAVLFARNPGEEPEEAGQEAAVVTTTLA
jgi:MFS family permease